MYGVRGDMWKCVHEGSAFAASTFSFLHII